MKIREVMTEAVVTVEPEALLKDAARILVDKGISGMPVVDAEGKVIGVLSEADVVAKERNQRSAGGFMSWLVDPPDAWLERRMQATTAGEAMSRPAVTIGADRPVAEAATLMLDEGVNRLPVVDEAGKLVGIVSRADLVRTFVRADDEIKAEIEDAVIKRTLWLEPATVTVAVENGVVALAGEVDTEQDAHLLETFARRVPGVVSVASTVRCRDTAKT